MSTKKRKENEKKFGKWTQHHDGSRVYFYEVNERFDWKARYIKEVDSEEKTLKFYQ